MAFEVTQKRIRWGLALVVAFGVALGILLADNIYQMRGAERIGERTGMRVQQKAVEQPPGEKSCTDGVDCYCDKVTDSGHAFYDPNLVMCEDFESLNLYENVGYHAGAPDYGPPHDELGGSGAWNCGRNQHWRQKYGLAIGQCSWSTGMVCLTGSGNTCQPSGSGCQGAKFWTADNRWGSNSNACLVINRDGDYNDEIPSHTEPSNASDGGSGVFDGQQALSTRVQVGAQGGTLTALGFATSFEIGWTQAFAYPVDAATAGGFNKAWKHLQLNTVGGGPNGVAGDHPIFNHNQSGPTERTPWSHPIWIHCSGCSNADCTSAMSGADVRRGAYTCNSSDGRMWLYPLVYNSTPGDIAKAYYKRSVDFPYGSWGCLRAHLFGLGSTNQGIKVWFQGPNMTSERLIIDIDGISNTTAFANRTGYNTVVLNNYANANQSPLNNPTTSTAVRYNDNIHMTRNGPPVSCEQIGFP